MAQQTQVREGYDFICMFDVVMHMIQYGLLSSWVSDIMELLGFRVLDFLIMIMITIIVIRVGLLESVDAI